MELNSAEAVIPSLMEELWDFQAEIKLYDYQSNSFSERVVFDPAISDTVIPERLRPNADVTVKISNNGRVSVPCESKRLSPQFTLETGQVIRIPNAMMANPDQPLCGTRLVFKGSLVIIGRMLLRAVDAVILDYRAKRMGFRSKATNVYLGPFVDPARMIPLLQYPVVSEWPDPQIVFRGDPAATSGYLLLSEAGRMEESETFETMKVCWDFVSYPPTTVSQERVSVVAGIFSNAALQIGEDQIQIVLELADNLRFQIVIRQAGDRQSVCREECDWNCIPRFAEIIELRTNSCCDLFPAFRGRSKKILPHAWDET